MTNSGENHMEKTTFKALNDLWIAQRKLFEGWQRSLVGSAFELRNVIEKLLKIPAEKFVSIDGRQQRRYVEILDLSLEQKPIAKSFSQDAFTDNGELFFGLSFLFEYGVDAYPKWPIHIAIAVRFSKKQLQFCFWDTENMQVLKDNSWRSDREEFANDIIEKLIKHFRFDPFEGFQDKLSIGFVKER